MIEKFKKILKELEDSKGEIKLFALLKMDEIVDKWSIILSASWITDEEQVRDKIFDEVIDKIDRTLTDTETDTIARLSLYNVDNYLVDLIANRCGNVVGEDMKTLNNEAINGNQIHEAVILRSRVS